jgi:N-dimethylarginine dimethylaminohydrolase
MCSPVHFQIVKPINYTQWLYYSDGLPKPEPWVMVQQHHQLVQTLRDQGVEVQLLPSVPGLPYQHATRDVGVVINDTLLISNMREETRHSEAKMAQLWLESCGLHVIVTDHGFLEGGDVFVDGSRIWVGIGSRTDEAGAEYLDWMFGRDYEVIPVFFDPKYTHLDTIFSILGQGCALVFEPAFAPASLRRIHHAFPSVIALNAAEQQSAGANILNLGPKRLISIAENEALNRRLIDSGFEVVPVAFSEVTKSGGSVRCDTLPVERS